MLAPALRRSVACLLFSFVSLAAVAGCGADGAEPTAAASAAQERNHEGDDEGTVDPDYVGEWVVAPGATANFTSLELQADGRYTLTRPGDTESGTWRVLFHDDWDWIWVHELWLRSDSGLSTMYGTEASASSGAGAFYPDGGSSGSFTVLTQKLAANIPSSCDVQTQGCGGGALNDVLACIPAESSSPTGTCTSRARSCATSSGCADRADMCIVPSGHFGTGYCVPRSADVPSCDVAAQDCADPALVCMPHLAGEPRGFCQRAFSPCTQADDFLCRIGNSVCVTTPTRSFCARKE